jgi:hypothetical protein
VPCYLSHEKTRGTIVSEGKSGGDGIEEEIDDTPSSSERNADYVGTVEDHVTSSANLRKKRTTLPCAVPSLHLPGNFSPTEIAGGNSSIYTSVYATATRCER